MTLEKLPKYHFNIFLCVNVCAFQCALFFRVYQENRDPQEHLEIKAPQAQLVCQVLMGHVVMLVLMYVETLKNGSQIILPKVCLFWEPSTVA